MSKPAQPHGKLRPSRLVLALAAAVMIPVGAILALSERAGRRDPDRQGH